MNGGKRHELRPDEEKGSQRGGQDHGCQRDSNGAMLDGPLQCPA